MSPAFTGAITPLRRYLVLPWELEEGGYYIHGGRCYLQGSLFNPTPKVESSAEIPPLPTTVLSHLPAAIRPSQPTPLTLICAFQAENIATPPIKLREAFDATVFPNGTLVLNSLPEYADSLPYDGVKYLTFGGARFPYFVRPLVWELLLANVSWPVGLAADSPTYQSFAALLRPEDFEDIDSEYAVHGSRLHLRGSVRALRDTASRLTVGYPDKGTPALAEGGNGWTDCHISGTRRPLLLEEFAVVMDAQDLVGGLLTSHNGQRFQGVGVTAMPENGLGYEEWEVGPHEPFFAFHSYGEHSCFHPPTPITCKSGGAVKWPNVGLPIADEIDIDVLAALASWYPLPDWFTIALELRFYCKPGVFGCPLAGVPCKPNIITFEMVTGEDEAAEWSEWDTIWTPPDAGLYEWKSLREADDPGPGGWHGLIHGEEDEAHHEIGRFFNSSYKEETFRHVEGPIVRTDGGGLSGQTLGPDFGSVGVIDPKLLWRPGELNSAGKMRFTGLVNQQGFYWALKIQPYWRLRDWYIKAGDVIDLTGSGWQLAQSEINIGPGEKGIAPLGRGRPERV